MPTYQYRCKQCADEFEKAQSFSDDSTPKCPTCGTRSKKNISKVFSQVGISFRGSGFYKNDHGGNGSKSSSSDGDSSDKDSSNKGSSDKDSSTTKTDSTSTTKADSSTKKSESSSTSSSSD